MAVKVLTAEYESDLNDVINGKYYLQICEAELRGRLLWNGELYAYSIRFNPGFKSDGASVPWGFRWFLPKWSEYDRLYNAIAKAHDLLYIDGGELDSGEKWTREESDDFLRGAWRETVTLKNSRFARFRCGTADALIHVFAGGKKHWKNDGLKCGQYGKIYLTRIEGD